MRGHLLMRYVERVLAIYLRSTIHLCFAKHRRSPIGVGRGLSRVDSGTCTRVEVSSFDVITYLKSLYSIINDSSLHSKMFI